MSDVEAMLAAGRAAWPEIDVRPEEFRAFLAARESYDSAWVGDLYLACACTSGHPGAIAAFTRTLLGDTGRYLGPLARSSELVDEVRQQLAIRLLVPPHARIADYGGRGPLEGWVRVAANRLALDLQRSESRRQRRGGDAGTARALEKAIDEPGLESLRARYRDEFGASLSEAMASLTHGERALLRLHYVEGATTAAMAALYRVSRATIVRRIAEARTSLFEATIARVTERVGLPPDEYATLLRLVRSHADLSIARLLAAP